MGLERSSSGGVAGPSGPTGPTGITGPTGPTGPSGSGGSGSVIRTGQGVPSNATGSDGDVWIDTLTGDLYLRASGSYAFQINLKGPAGEIGATGAPGNTGASAGTYLVSGATIAWVSGFTFRVGAAVYYLDGTLTTSAEQTVALDAADGTFDRFDVLVLDSSGTLGKVTGSASASPAEPSIDPSTYLRLGLVLVSAGASAAPVASTTLYAEGSGGEWSASASAGTITVGSTSNPRSGTKDIEGTSVAAGTTLTLTKPATSIDLATQEKLILYIRIKSAWASKKAMQLRWLAGAVQKGATVTVGNGLYGLNTGTTGAYQQVVVPLSAFSVPAGSAVTKLEIAFVGSGSSIGFYLDDLGLQAGFNPTGASLPFHWRGDWSSAAGYDQNDAVTRSGATYLAVQANTNQDPAATTTYWVRLADLTQVIVVACSDETTALTAGAAKVTFRMPFKMALSDIRANLNTASSSGVVTVDVNEGGVSILSTKVTIDANEKTSTTAATPPAISDASLADDAEMTVDIDSAGVNATGLKIALIGVRA